MLPIALAIGREYQLDEREQVTSTGDRSLQSIEEETKTLSNDLIKLRKGKLIFKFFE